MAVHVRYNFLYISLPSSAKQQREMTKFCAVYGTWTATANFSHFHLELYAVVAYVTCASCRAIGLLNRSMAKHSRIKYKFIFY